MRRQEVGATVVFALLLPALGALGQGLEPTETSTLSETETSTLTRTATVAEPPVLVEPLPPEAPPPKRAETSSVSEARAGTRPLPPVRLADVNLPNQLGPAWIDVADGRLRLGLAAQFRVEVRSVDDGADRIDETSVLIRRLRTTVAGRFLDDRLTFALQLNTTPGNFEVVDMWLDVEAYETLRFRVGQFKIPFGLYRQQSFTRLLLADWSRSPFWFGAERQLGLMIHNDDSGSGFDYRLGVFTGQNRRASFAVRIPQLYGEPVSNPSRVDGIGEVDRVSPEVVGAVRYASPQYREAARSDIRGGDLRYALGLSVAWDADPEPARDIFVRSAADVIIQFEHATLDASGYVALVEATQTDELLFGVAGFNAELAYRFNRWLEVALRYSLSEVSRELADDALAWGEQQIAAAMGPDAVADAQMQYATAGALRSEQELVLGGTLFVVGHSLKVQTDGGWVRRGLRTMNEDDFRFRGHIQLAF